MDVFFFLKHQLESQGPVSSEVGQDSCTSQGKHEAGRCNPYDLFFFQLLLHNMTLSSRQVATPPHFLLILHLHKLIAHFPSALNHLMRCQACTFHHLPLHLLRKQMMMITTALKSHLHHYIHL